MKSFLCDTCRKVFQAEAWDNRVVLGPECSFLRAPSYLPTEGAENGCALCLLFLSVMSEVEISTLRRNRGASVEGRDYMTEFIVDLHKNIHGLLTLVLHHYLMGRGGVAITIWKKKLELWPESKNSCPKNFQDGNVLNSQEHFNTEHPASGDEINSVPTWECVKHWITECDAAHPQCQMTISSSDGQVPSRLIEVGSDTASGLRLREDVPTHSKYATLSHCWGNHKPMELLHSNIERLKVCIPSSELPKTFQDAVEVTRKLDLQYLWIDSLCIIQDSEEDWLKESALMGRVYSNAELNITAAAAQDSRFGLFMQRNSLLLQPCRVEVEWRPLNYQLSGPYICFNYSLWEQEVTNSLVNKRAWVFQERALSPRTLSFGGSQLFWECGEKKACECFPLGLPDVTDRKALAFNSKRLEPPSNVNQHLTDYEKKTKGLLVWCFVITEYSGKTLTYGTDKLIAISAIARRCHELMPPNVEYLAGLWRDQIEGQLLWGNASDINTRQTKYRAPTWSWASVDGPVSMLFPKAWTMSHILVRVLEAKVDLVSSDPFGPVKGGHLKISCLLVKVDLVPPEPILQQYFDNSDQTFKYRMIERGSWKVKINGSVLHGEVSKDSNVVDSSSVHKPYQNLYVMPVLGKFSPSWDTNLDGILLELTDTNRNPVFQRFGVVKLRDQEAVHLWERTHENCASIAQELGLDSTFDEENGRSCKITIV
jgi:hypothetical protein